MKVKIRARIEGIYPFTPALFALFISAGASPRPARYSFFTNFP